MSNSCHCAQCSGAGPDAYGWKCDICHETISVVRGCEVELGTCADCGTLLCPECPQFICSDCGQTFCLDHLRKVASTRSLEFCPGCYAEMVASEEAL